MPGLGRARGSAPLPRLARQGDRAGRAGPRARGLGPAVLAVAAAAAALATAVFAGAAAPCWLSPAGGRRGALSAAVAAVTLATGAEKPANAFDNAVKKVQRDINNPKKKGPQPEDIGLAPRRDAEGQRSLKECSENAPNCLSTTGNFLDVGYHQVEPWTYTKSREDAIKDVEKAINDYPPGQSGIDGGGYKIMAQDEECVYVQFESLKRGHIDDVELCLKPDTEGVLIMRSSSRQGFWDYGVNAIRLNRIARDLGKYDGWKTKQIDRVSHPQYWQLNCDGGDRRKAPFVTRDKFPSFCKA